MNDVIATAPFEADPNKATADPIVKTLALVTLLERQIKSVEMFAGMCAVDLKMIRALLERYQQQASLPPPLTERSSTMSYNVTSTFKAGAKPAVARSWSGLEKAHVIDKVEKGLIKVLSQMSDYASDFLHKKATPPHTNPVLVTYNLAITKDGQPWASSTFEWPGMGDEAQAHLLHLLDGAFKGMGKDVAAKETHRTP